MLSIVKGVLEYDKVRLMLDGIFQGMIRSETGINDAGMEQFRADLVRPWPECIQNSTDARGSYSNEPVMVTFHLVEIPQKSFPGAEQLQEALKQMSDYWKPRNDRKTDSFLEDALDCLLPQLYSCYDQ